MEIMENTNVGFGDKDIYVLAQVNKNGLHPITTELLSAARNLAEYKNENVAVILFGHGVKKYAADLIAYGADIVHLCDSAEYTNYSTMRYAAAVTHVIKTYNPSVVLIGATAMGRDLAPRVSARLRTGLTADCTSLEMKDDGLYMTRPAFGGNLFATIACPDNRPQMSTVRPGVMKSRTPDKNRTGKIIEFAPPKSDDRLVLVEEKAEVAVGDDITKSPVLVSIGRGAGKDCIDTAKSVAALLKGTISGSRAMVDAGHLPSDRQVGQTGKTVRPQLYLALGISGAVQHLAGMEESEVIIAVNRDRNAPIFSVSELGVVGDAKKVLPALLKLLSAERKA